MSKKNSKKSSNLKEPKVATVKTMPLARIAIYLLILSPGTT
jgi:hypothetical protein